MLRKVQEQNEQIAKLQQENQRLRVQEAPIAGIGGPIIGVGEPVIGEPVMGQPFDNEKGHIDQLN